jgi:dihydroorotate dehydrogenase
MSRVYRTLLRPLLFRQDSERIHNRTLKMLSWAGRRRWACGLLEGMFREADLPVELFGLRFPNPVGLAAGMDKEAAAVPTWAALGFGFSELGGVTWRAQPGNPSPRMFRAIADDALVNRMGFNNSGAEAVAARLAEWRRAGRWPGHPVGMNLGKSKDTPLKDAAEDYSRSLGALLPHADFFVVNVSSPNTPNLRQLQDKAALAEILAALQETNERAANSAAGQGTKPILVKVAPDLAFEALDEILELAAPGRIAGIVATNTTITRPERKDAMLAKVYAESGGLSGRPLAARSTEVIRHIYRRTAGKLPIIGVGGIFDAEGAWEKIAAGASGMVRGLRRRLEEQGWKTILQAVGSKAGAKNDG